MAINFNSFTEGTTSNIQSDDYVVGFDTAVPNGERKYTISTIANAVSGLIKTEMANFMNDTLTLGNYPYLEYAWVTAPNTIGQQINQNVITTLTLTTEVVDTGNFGSISSNEITLAAGTYQFEANTHASQAAGIGGSGTLALVKTDGTYVSRGSSQSGYADNCDNPILKGQFTILSQTIFELRYYNVNNISYIKNTSSNLISTISTPSNAEQRTTIKLWKVG